MLAASSPSPPSSSSSSPSSSSGASGGPTVAVCVAGMVRTLTHPLVWGSLRQNVLEDGKIDLYAVLGLAGSTSSPLGWNDLQREGPSAVRSMLLALAPRRTRFVNWEPPRQCGGPSGVSHLQFAKWSLCVDLLPPDAPYQYLFRTRPDVVWRMPLHLRDLAANMPADDVVLTKNDYHMLWPRAQWHVLSRFRSLLCDARCDNGLTFSSLNEYCLMKAHLARHGARHLEAKFPSEEWLMHFVSEAKWTEVFRNDGERLARWSNKAPPPQRASGIGMWCGHDDTLGIACEECAMSTATDDTVVKRLRRCPAEGDPHDLEGGKESPRLPQEATAKARAEYQPSEQLWEQLFTGRDTGRDGMAFLSCCAAAARSVASASPMPSNAVNWASAVSRRARVASRTHG